MDLRQIRTFVHVAELGKISAAAQRLNLAQSAVTRQLQLLEEDLGISLLQRHGRGVSTTHRGEAFLRRARGILREVYDAREEVRCEQFDLQGTVGIGVPPDLVRPLSLGLLDRVPEQLPGISLRVSCGFGADVAAWISQGAIDFGVLCEAVPAPTRKLYEIAKEELFVIAAAQFANELPETWSPGNIAAMPLVLPSHRHFMSGALAAAFAAAGVTPRIAVEIDDLQVLLSVVAQGRGITIASARAIECAAEADRGLLRAIPPAAHALSRTLAVAVPLDRTLPPAALRLRDLVVALLRGFVAAGSGAERNPNCTLTGGSCIPPRDRTSSSAAQGRTPPRKAAASGPRSLAVSRRNAYP